jgi:YfiH family protein
MIKIEKFGLTFYQSCLLTPYKNLKHAFFTKKGGFSNPPFEGLNLGVHTDDCKTCLEANLNAVKKCLGFEDIYFLKQVHDDKCIVIKSTHCNYHEGFDAQMTNISNIGLLVSHADCQPAIFFDPRNNCVATIHCGWRGSKKNIYEKTIRKMQLVFGSKPCELLVAIGPSLGPIHANFINYKNELPPNFFPFKKDEHLFDFWQISKMQLLQAGVREENIDIAEICTYENDEFYSYRRQHDKSRLYGASALVAGLSSN